jgi:TrmH family RNA methyltransferase
MTVISSTSNPRIKDLLKLSKSKERKESGLFVIEGYREISRAIKAGIEIESIYFCPDHNNVEHIELLKMFTSEILTEVSPAVFSRIAYRDNSDGLIAVAKQFKTSLEDLKPSDTALFLVLETVEKPGNLGAVMRTADAAGISAVIICDNQTDIFNPNTVRASLGCIFTVPVIGSSTDEAIEWFKKNNIRIYAAALQNSKEYTETDFRKPSAIVLGSEADGLSSSWRHASDEIIRIPMNGIADSLNVSVSAAILIFEALRQRK